MGWGDEKLFAFELGLGNEPFVEVLMLSVAYCAINNLRKHLLQTGKRFMSSIVIDKKTYRFLDSPQSVL